MNLTESHFQQIEASALLYNDQLVWSGVEQETMKVIYKIATESKPVADSIPGAKITESSGAGFLTQWSQGEQGGHIKIHMQDGRALRLCVCEKGQVLALFLVREAEAEPSTLSKLSKYVASEATNLAELIAENYAPSQGIEEPWRYLYFNEMNLALKTSIKTKKATEIGPEVMSVLNEMHTMLTSQHQACTELCVRQQKEGWIVGRKSNERLLYAILESKGSTLAEISEDLDNLLAQCFNNIFI